MRKSRVYVVGGDYLIEDMFKEAFDTELTTDVQSADLMCFTGGADVSPDYYGEAALPETHCAPHRDDVERYLYWLGVGLGIPIVGICRGGQLINVLNGGKMWQHVNNHTADHKLLDIDSQDTHYVTSTHHQMMRPSAEALIVAEASRSTYKQAQGQSVRSNDNVPLGKDIEVLWYDKTNSLCFQPHPEYGSDPCLNYFKKLVNRFALLDIRKAG